jgi:hypothetical protein
MKRTLALLAVMCALMGCQRAEDPKVLSRERAVTLITQAPAFQKVLDINFHLQPNNPQALVARHLGYIEPDKLALTERGRQLWRDMNLQVNEHAVPVARTQLGEVTGISMSGNAADGKFTWQWIPNDVGKTLVIDSPEFRALPEDIQTKIRQPSRAMTPAFASGNSGFNFGGVRQGTGNFQLCDDGWRVTHVYLF